MILRRRIDMENDIFYIICIFEPLPATLFHCCREVLPRGWFNNQFLGSVNRNCVKLWGREREGESEGSRTECKEDSFTCLLHLVLQLLSIWLYYANLTCSSLLSLSLSVFRLGAGVCQSQVTVQVTKNQGIKTKPKMHFCDICRGKERFPQPQLGSV